MFNKLVFLFTFLITSIGSAQMAQNNINGRITEMNKPLSNVKIGVKDKEAYTLTDKNGTYVINASPGEWLVYSKEGMKDVSIFVEEVTSILNIEMFPEIIELDEVVVKKRAPRNNKQLELEYDENKNLIRTTYGILDKNRVSSQMQIIDGDDIIPFGTSFIDALPLQRNFFGRVDRQNNLVYTRNYSQVPAIYDVDGMVMTDAPVHIAIDDIKRMAIISGMGVVAKYGLRGNGGGVVVINTKFRPLRYEPGTDKPYDYAKLRNNIYKGEADKNERLVSISKPLQEMAEATSREEAMALFNSQRRLYGSSPYYLMDVADIFLKKWQSQEQSNQILNMVRERFADNAVVLKALAYVYEYRKQFDKATELYKDIFILRPGYAQSYRDLANSYATNGDYKKAMDLYARYHSSRQTDTITAGLKGIVSIMRTETNHTVRTWADQLAYGIKSDVERDSWPVRIMLEWNNSEAEFELQFVNPQNRYFVWNHSLEKTPERIQQEKVKGFSSEQFLIDESLLGKWDINMKYLGNKSYVPTYFKMTVYYDYGTAAQRERTKIFSFRSKNANRKLISLNNRSLAFDD